MNFKKRLFSLLLVISMLLGTSAAPVGAAEEFVDLPSTHWAYPEMSRAASLGILSGIGNGQMAPSMSLDWGQFLAMLTRTFASESYANAVAQGLAWDQAGYAAAVEAGLLTENDFLPVDSSRLKDPITRQDVAVLLDRALPAEIEPWYSFWNEPPVAEEILTDWSTLEEEYQTSVERLVSLEIIYGKSDNTFGGTDTLQRSDGSALLIRTLNELDGFLYGEEKNIIVTLVDTSGNFIAEAPAVSYVGQGYYTLHESCGMPYYVYEGDYASVSSACDRYTVVVRPMTEPEIQEQQFLEKIYQGEATWEEYYQQDFWLYFQGGNPRKYTFLFGSEDKNRFANREEAEANMTTVTVPVWKLKSDGTKYSSTANFSIHSALAEEIVEIFTEIYNDPEQFPIKSLGGYSWRGDSATGEHNCGTAVDLNPNENYQIRDGQVMTGSLWEPGVNPYSIAENSSVVRIFAEHGWSWGGTAWAYDSDPATGYHDYMHFSYMGG